MYKHITVSLFILVSLLCFSSIAFASIAQNPLFLTTGGKANVLVVLDNSNSMDEDATGAAVGSANANSKSEITRGVIQGLITTYTGQLNMGLMSYQQDAIAARQLHNAPYDVSFDPLNYDATFVGARDSLTKRYRVANSSSPGDFVHYNVNLPFYSSNNEGTAFCYSATANFDNGGETAGAGPWDRYRCYRNKTVASDVLPAWQDEPSETAAGFTTLMGEYTFSPTDSDYAQNILDFGRFMSWSYVSPTWYSNGSPGRGFLHTSIAPLDATQAGLLNTKLGTSQFVTNAPTNSAWPLQNAGLTPIEGTLLTARDYFANSGWNAAAEGYTAACYPLPESCDHDYVILVTDGLPSVDDAGNNVSGASALSDAAAAAADLMTDGVKTYVVGFAMPLGTDPTALDQLALAGGTTTALLATDPLSLETALGSALTDILSQSVGSAAAIATNSTRLIDNTLIYQARFDSSDWSGSLLAYAIDNDGSLANVKWSTDLGGIPIEDSRAIFSWNGSDGISFEWGNLSTDQQALLTEDQVDWLRGDQLLEEPVGLLRARTKILGDIINSDPLVVGVPNFRYESLPIGANIGGDLYAAFRLEVASRPRMLYVGANDGQLHAFVAETGEEKFAYVPAGVYENLADLTRPEYVHKYYVDGPPAVGDAYVGLQWKTIVVGGLGAGGRSIYALDVTDPNNFDHDNVLWEFGYADTDCIAGVTACRDIGYTFGKPVLARMQNGDWAAIFGNGYESDDRKAKLFIVNAESGELIRAIEAIDTVTVIDAEHPNGLSAPALLADETQTIIYAYAGDLHGNLWKFDLTSADESDWGVALNDSPLFTTQSNQPITAPLNIGVNENGGYMIYFGTGKYFEVGDNDASDPSVNPGMQSFYGVWDVNDNVRDDLGKFAQQTIDYEGQLFTGSGDNLRVVSDNDVVYPSNANPNQGNHGWYIDLESPVHGLQGERVVSAPLLRRGRVVFTTLIPDTDPCSPGGTSWLMELDAMTGGRLSSSVLDINDDGVIDEGDFVEIDDPDNPGENILVSVSGRKSEVGIVKTPAVIEAGTLEFKYFGGSDGQGGEVVDGDGTGIEIVIEAGGDEDEFGRRSWRQLR